MTVSERMEMMMEWKPIDTAPLGEMVLLWQAAWRHLLPGRRNGDAGQVFVDTCELEARGWQTSADLWMPMPWPPGVTPPDAAYPLGKPWF